MSITDPIEVVYLERWGVWYLRRGRETFYDDMRRLRTWSTAEEAAEWCHQNLGEDVIMPDA